MTSIMTFEYNDFAVLRDAIRAHDGQTSSDGDPFAMQSSLAIGSSGMQEDAMADLFVNIAGMTPTTVDKTFWNQLYSGRIPEGTIAEMLAAYMNNSMYTFKVSGIQTLIEKEVIAHMLQKVGYAQGDGTFAAGGSMSNMVAMLLARNEKIVDCKERGIQGHKLVAYTSDQGHYSVKKNAGILGMGRDSVRKVPSDAQGKIDVEALKQMIQEDQKSGHIPYLVNLTAGTTVLGAYDPIEEVVEMMQATLSDDKVWIHVDASRGGGVLLSKQHRSLMNGVHKADSCTWNPHKMMGVPLSASALLVQQKGIINKHLSEGATYLYQSDDEDLNLGNKSLQCGRRNDAFKVRAAWKKLGDEGYEQRVHTQFAMVAHALKRIDQADELELVLQPACLNVCFTINNHDAAQICQGLYEQNLLKVGHGTRQNKTFVRLVCVNAELDVKGVDFFFDTLLSYLGML